MIVDAEGYRFDFSNAITAFKFDETDKTSQYFHGAPMKCVDVVVEFAHQYVFVEIKEYENQDEFDSDSTADKKKRDNFKWLKNYLKYKYRDSYLYRYAEEKTDKPVHYICLLNFDNALNTVMRTYLRTELPVTRTPQRWTKKIVESCNVLNLDAWNRNFPKWPAQKLTP